MKEILTQLNELETQKIMEIIGELKIEILKKYNVQELVNVYQEICYSYYAINEKEMEEYNLLEEEETTIFNKLNSMNLLDNDDLWFAAFDPIETKRKEIKKKYNRFFKKYSKVLDYIDSILFDKTNGEWGETIYG